MSPGSNTPLWPLLVLDGRLNLARFNQSACRAEPRTREAIPGRRSKYTILSLNCKLVETFVGGLQLK